MLEDPKGGREVDDCGDIDVVERVLVDNGGSV